MKLKANEPVATRLRSLATGATELVENAPANAAPGDDFGEKLVARKGAIPADVKLEV